MIALPDVEISYVLVAVEPVLGENLLDHERRYGSHPRRGDLLAFKFLRLGDFRSGDKPLQNSVIGGDYNL